MFTGEKKHLMLFYREKVSLLKITTTCRLAEKRFSLSIKVYKNMYNTEKSRKIDRLITIFNILFKGVGCLF